MLLVAIVMCKAIIMHAVLYTVVIPEQNKSITHMETKHAAADIVHVSRLNREMDYSGGSLFLSSSITFGNGPAWAYNNDGRND